MRNMRINKYKLMLFLLFISHVFIHTRDKLQEEDVYFMSLLHCIYIRLCNWNNVCLDKQQ